ncbi:hypothetical protein LOK49_LG12G01716 [Camellia lanceoleosa]|uniref:Uncharacterized protein n=1 Tax=Camellia lanceoleosa TaxID=1840588 RepID=A0ACC0FUZ7_9ERIC|nr:hypothetical protein LOK49_LG12G01716 [Camellia lanceoleosa]
MVEISEVSMEWTHSLETKPSNPIRKSRTIENCFETSDRIRFEQGPSLLERNMLTEAIAVLGMCVVLWAYQAIIRPPPPKICGSKKGPPITSPRIKLSDGRHLAYKERGVPKKNAQFKVIVVHGFDSSKDLYLPISQSDPNPKRSVKSEAYDLQELADNLHLGPKFHVIGVSIGTYTTWACLKYIPHRLAGVGLIVPVINFWWPSFPPQLCTDEYKKQPMNDRWKLRVAHYAPGLLYWWMTQKWFPSCSIMARDPVIFAKRDFDILKSLILMSIRYDSKARVSVPRLDDRFWQLGIRSNGTQKPIS